jgi:peptidoglycan/LPS O-acetylase OafA/YrhL
VFGLGALPSLVIAAASSFASCWFILQIVTTGKALLGNNVPWPGWYYQWIFAPRVLWDVVAGIFVAHFWRGRVSAKATWVALGLTALGIFAAYVARGGPDEKFGPVREMAVAHIVDVPLSIALLGLFRMAPLPAGARRFLAFCGVWSWGIYLSHLLVHELVQIAGFRPFMLAQPVRAVYALALLVSGAFLAVLAARIEKLLLVRRARSRLPRPA